MMLLYRAKGFRWGLKHDKESFDPVSFADDTSVPEKLESVEYYQELLDFFNTLITVTDYSINQAKQKFSHSIRPSTVK